MVSKMVEVVELIPEFLSGNASCGPARASDTILVCCFGGPAAFRFSRLLIHVLMDGYMPINAVTMNDI